MDGWKKAAAVKNNLLLADPRPPTRSFAIALSDLFRLYNNPLKQCACQVYV
jgi:hypothetical protein